VLIYALEDLQRAGITDIAVILGLNGREQVIERIGDGSQYGVNVSYIDQGAPLGIAHAVACAEDFMGQDPFVVYLGDNILRHGIARWSLSSMRERATPWLRFSASLSLNATASPSLTKQAVA